MTTRTVGRAALAVAGAGALLALGSGFAHADTTDEHEATEGPDTSADQASGDGAEPGTEGSGVPVFVLDGAPALPVPDGLLTPVDLTAPVFGVLQGLS